MQDTLNIKNKILSRIVIQPNECWEWQGALGGSNDEYGVIRINKKNWYTHRLSYTLFKKDIPERLNVCHTCDNPKCINPEHLFLGTQEDNIHDCIKKGRKAINTAHNRSITQEKAEEIKKYISNKYPEKSIQKIADCFNVSYILVYQISKGNYYKV